MNKQCSTCKYHEHRNSDDSWVCVNPESEYYADWTDYDDSCEDWEGEMIIQCGSCGHLKNIPHKGTPEGIEQGIYKTIQAGWRYVKSYDGYICPKCIKDNPDKLYEAVFGKVIPENKSKSYSRLLKDVTVLLKNLHRIDEGLPPTEGE